LHVQSKVAEYITDRGLKKSRVAELSGIRISRLSLILNNHTEMRADEFANICSALEVSPTKFIPAPKKKIE